MSSALVLGLILLALIVTVWSAGASLARSPHSRRPGNGVLARLLCPRTRERVVVQIGRAAGTGVPAVTWCQYDTAGPVTCGRECFVPLDGAEGDPSVLDAPSAALTA
jgi:hypothetical protein